MILVLGNWVGGGGRAGDFFALDFIGGFLGLSSQGKRGKIVIFLGGGGVSWGVFFSAPKSQAEHFLIGLPDANCCGDRKI